MNNQSPFDRSLLIPIGVGVFSLIGICILLVLGRITALRGNVQEVPTATAFKYALVGTEPAITTVTIEATEFAPPAATEAPIILFTSTSSSLSTPILLSPVATNALSGTPITLRTSTSSVGSTNTPTKTATSASTAPLQANTYEDSDYHIIYAGSWTIQSAVSGAYLNSLHVSSTIGNAATFQFIGQELRVFFQAGPSLGTIRINIDGTDYDPMDESNATTQTYEWVLPSVTNGTHAVTITHLSGGSVNLDYMIIPEVPVTPTMTPTTRP